MRIKDNSLIQKEDCKDIVQITGKVANKTLAQLEREGIFVFPSAVSDTEDLTSDQMILQELNGCYRTGNVMGFLGFGEERLTIESRFSKGEKDFFFQYLLEKVLEFPNVVNLESEVNRDTQLFNMLLFLFPQYLRKAVRKGLFKTYIRNEYNDENITGSIDVARHIRKNIPFTGNIAYSQREFVYDNYLIELIRHTIEFIKRESFGNKLLELVGDEVKLVINATGKYKASDKRRIIDLNKKNTVRHAYYHEYRDLQKLCMLILHNEKHQMGAGTNKVFGILFDGAWLWEEYVNLLISDTFYHPMNKGGKGAQWLFAGNTGLIYPDFISKDAEDRIIADAKYKPLANIANKDYLQVLAYMFRFDAKEAYYLYPEAECNEDSILILNQGSSYEKVSSREDIRLVKHGLKIPANILTYDEFVERMEVAETKFKVCLSHV